MTGGLELNPDCGFSGPEEGGMILLNKITLSWFLWNGLTKHMRQKILLGNAGPERLTSDQYMSESWSPHSQFPGLIRKMWVLALGLYLRCCHRLDVSSILLNIKLCGFPFCLRLLTSVSFLLQSQIMRCFWMLPKRPSFPMTPRSWSAGSQTYRTPKQTSASPFPGTTGSTCSVTMWWQRSSWPRWMQTGLCCLGTGAERGLKMGK